MHDDGPGIRPESEQRRTSGGIRDRGLGRGSVQTRGAAACACSARARRSEGGWRRRRGCTRRAQPAPRLTPGEGGASRRVTGRGADHRPGTASDATRRRAARGSPNPNAASGPRAVRPAPMSPDAGAGAPRCPRMPGAAPSFPKGCQLPVNSRARKHGNTEPPSPPGGRQRVGWK